MILFLVFLIRWLFFKNLDRQLLRFAVSEHRLRIEYINKNKSLNKVHEILLSQLRGFLMFEYTRIPRQICIIFKLKDHTKLRVTLEYSKIINGTETQTEEIIEEIISSFSKYNANRIEITVHNTAQYFMPFLKKGYHLNPKNDSVQHNTLKTIIFQAEDLGRTDYSATVYYMLKSELGSEAEISNVTLKAFDRSNKEIATRYIPDVTLQANKRTRLTGKIFTPHPSTFFDIEITDDWDSEVPEFVF